MANENPDYTLMGDQAHDAELELKQEAAELRVMLTFVLRRAKEVAEATSLKIVRNELREAVADLEDVLEAWVAEATWEEEIAKARAGA